jgi:hypothetical protein
MNISCTALVIASTLKIVGVLLALSGSTRAHILGKLARATGGRGNPTQFNATASRKRDQRIAVRASQRARSWRINFDAMTASAATACPVAFQ